MTSLRLLARPGSARETISWDDWRKRWVIACREPPRDGQANEGLLRVLASALEVRTSQLRWLSGTRARAKVVEIDGLSEDEVGRRLRKASARSASPQTQG